ncbi:DUF6192 family protein [Actinoplanes nipponensis]
MAGAAPLDPRTGQRRWLPDAARRLMGRQVGRPESVQEEPSLMAA